MVTNRIAEFSNILNSNFTPQPSTSVTGHYSQVKSPSSVTNSTINRQSSGGSVNNNSVSFDSIANKSASLRLQQERFNQLQQMSSQPNSPTYNRTLQFVPPANSPNYNRPQVNVRATSPHLNRPASPHYQRAASPHYQRAASPHYQRAASPHYQRAPSPHYQRAKSPSYQRIRAPSPHYGRSVQPQVPAYNAAYAASNDSYLRYNRAY